MKKDDTPEGRAREHVTRLRLWGVRFRRPDSLAGPRRAHLPLPPQTALA